MSFTTVCEESPCLYQLPWRGGRGRGRERGREREGERGGGGGDEGGREKEGKEEERDKLQGIPVLKICASNNLVIIMHALRLSKCYLPSEVPQSIQFSNLIGQLKMYSLATPFFKEKPSNNS